MALDLSALTDGSSGWGPPTRAALTYLDTQSSPETLSATYALARVAPVDAVETWGHSYPAGVGIAPVTAGVNDMSTLLAQFLRLPLRQQAVGGTALYNYLSAASNWTNILQKVTRSGSWTSPGGLVVSMYGMNDLSVLAAYTLPAMQPFLMAQRVAISRWRAGRIFENTDPTVVLGGAGTWSSAAGVANSGGDVAYNDASGATITITTPADFPGGTIALGFMAWTDTGGATISGTVNGIVYSVNTAALATAANKSASVLRIPSVPAGSASYVFTSTSPVGGVGAMFDYWQWEPADALCPLVVLVKQPHPLDYTGYTTNPPTDASVDIMNAAFDTLAAEFGSQVLTVDTSALNNNATYFIAGNVHPTVAGHLRLAQLIRDAIKSQVTPFYSPPASNSLAIPYVPVVGAGWALGNAIVDAQYMDIGGVIHWAVSITWGSTSTFGTGRLSVTLPVPTAANPAKYGAVAKATKQGVGSYFFNCFYDDTTHVGLYTTAAPVGSVTATAPFTHAAGDIVYASGTYQAA